MNKQTTQRGPRVMPAWARAAWLGAILLLVPAAGRLDASHIQQIDPYPLNSVGSTRRWIDDIEGGVSNGIALTDGQVIDVVILGDGYLADEDDDFLSDAKDWYDDLFGSSGIVPYTYFKQAFRVRSIFKASDDHVSPERDSFYRVDVEYRDSGYPELKTGTTTDADFRAAVFSALAELDPDLNRTLYPDDLDTDGYVDNLKDLYSNLVVVMLVRARQEDDSVNGASGASVTIEDPDSPARLKMAIASNEKHEFGHAFALLDDEYIENTGSSVSKSNPAAADRSVFKLSNYAYSNDRCDLLWPHLAPGGRYNPRLNSKVGNLFKGGYHEDGVWHSEYRCLMNGTHNNYFCDVDPAASGWSLRDASHLCFWCEEITAVRILEKTQQLLRSGDPSDINDRGKTWFQRWDSTLRDRYYEFYDIPSRIINKTECYNAHSGASCSSDCQDACDQASLPCLADCNIREIGNALYVDSSGSIPPFADGSRAAPLFDLSTAIGYSHSLCTDPALIEQHVVAIIRGSYPGPYTLKTPAVLIAGECGSVVLGR